MIYSENILICIAIPLVVMLPFLPVKSRRLFTGLILGMIASLFGAYLNRYFSGICQMNATDTARYISPIVEELMKLLPIMIYMLLFSPENRELMGFAIAVGAGFATFENCCYITQNGSELMQFILFRGLAVGVMHVVCGLVIGISVTLVKRYKAVMIPGTIGAFSFATTIHALYNLLVSVEGIPTIVGFFTPLLVLALIFFFWSENKSES